MDLITWKAGFRGLMRDMCVKFQPWQDMNQVKAEVKKARARAPRLPWRVGGEWTWRFTLRPGETRQEWGERMSVDVAYLARKLELAEKGER